MPTPGEDFLPAAFGSCTSTGNAARVPGDRDGHEQLSGANQGKERVPRRRGRSLRQNRTRIEIQEMLLQPSVQTQPKSTTCWTFTAATTILRACIGALLIHTVLFQGMNPDVWALFWGTGQEFASALLPANIPLQGFVSLKVTVRLLHSCAKTAEFNSTR